AGGDGHGRLYLWDVARGVELWRCDAHRGAITALAFDDAGGLLASAGLDTTVLVWETRDLPLARLPSPEDLSPEQVLRFWADLRDEDAASAQRAIRALAAGGAVPFLRSQLEPTTFLPLTQIEPLVPDLD